MSFKLNNLKQVDLFGRRTELSMNGQKSHKTWCGTFCTILIFIICIISTIFYASEFFRRSNPTYIFSEIYDSTDSYKIDNRQIAPFEEIQLNYRNYFAMMGILDTKYNINDYQIQFNIYQNGNILSEFQGIKCSEVEYFKEMLENENIADMKKFEVVKKNPDKFICLGQQNSQSLPFVYEQQSRVEIKLICGKFCNELSGQKLVILSADYLVIPQNYDNPLNLYIMDKYIQLDSKFTTHIDIRLQKVRINTDNGYILQNQDYIQQVTFKDHMREDLVRDIDDPLLIITIVPFSKRIIYDRSYPKLLTLISIVGGLLKSLMVLGAFCTKPFSKLSMRSDLVNRLFTFEIKSEKKTPKLHEMGFYEDNEENEEKNQNNFKRSKTLNIGNQNNKDPSILQNGISRLNTNFKTDDNLFSIDQLKIQLGEQNTSYLKKSPVGTNNNLDNLMSGSSQKGERCNYFRYPSNQSGIDCNSLNQFQSMGDQQIFKSQADEQFKPQRNYYDNNFDNQNNIFINQTPLHQRVNQIKYQEKLSSLISNKKESIIISQHEDEEQSTLKEENQEKMNQKEQSSHHEYSKKQRQTQSMFNFDLDKNQDQAQVNTDSPSQDSQKQIAPQEQIIQESAVQEPQTIRESSNTLNQQQMSQSEYTTPNVSPEKQNMLSSTRSVMRGGLTLKGLVKRLQHSHSIDDTKSQLEFQKEGEESQQRRNANFDRDKRTFSKKGTGKNTQSLNHINNNNEDDKKQQIEVDKSLNKHASLKKQISKKETLKSQKQEQPQQPDVNQSQSSARRIKSFFSTKTKEITSLIRFNIQQKQKQSLDNNKTLKGNDLTGSNENLDQLNEEDNKGNNKQTSFTKQNTHKQFEGILNEKQEKSIVFSLIDYVKYFFNCFKVTPKVNQMKYTNKKVKKRLDIIYILEKLIEIDKLKVLLLNPDQINLFDYMPKEFVSCDLQEGDDIDMFFKNNKFSTWSLLCADRSTLDKYSNACIAYHHIQQNGSKTKIDKKLIQMLDPQIKRYFNKTLIQRDEIKNYRSLQANYSIDEKQQSESNTPKNNNLIQNQLDNRFQNQEHLKDSQYQGHYNPFLLQNQQSSISKQSFNDKSYLSKSTYQWGQDSLQRQNSQLSNLYNSSRQNTEFSAVQAFERRLSASSPNNNTLFTKSPKQQISKVSLANNQNDIDLNSVKKQKNRNHSSNAKQNTYCVPIIEESNNMLSSEKFGIPQSLKEITLPPSIFDKRNSQPSYVQSIVLKNEDISFKNINPTSQQQIEQQVQNQEEVLCTDPVLITEYAKEDIIKFENSSLNQPDEDIE